MFSSHFLTNPEFAICDLVMKNNSYIGILYSYIDSWMKIHLEQIKTNDKKKSADILSCRNCFITISTAGLKQPLAEKVLKFNDYITKIL